MNSELTQSVKVALGTGTAVGLTIANIQAYVAIGVGIITIIYTLVLIFDRIKDMIWKHSGRKAQIVIADDIIKKNLP